MSCCNARRVLHAPCHAVACMRQCSGGARRRHWRAASSTVPRAMRACGDLTAACATVTVPTREANYSECKPCHVHHATCGIRDATSNIIRRTYIRGTVPTQEQLLRALQQLGLQRQSTSRSVEHQTRLARSHGCPFQRRHCAARATATHCARSVGIRCSELRLQNIECRARQNLVDDRARQEGRYLARRVGDLIIIIARSG